MKEMTMTEQLLSDLQTLEVVLWEAVDLPPWEVLRAGRAACPGRTAAEIADVYADIIEVGLSPRVAPEIDVLKDLITGLNSLSRMQVWHVIGRIAGAI
jgi:hypothetical protein